jgi:hypothetical protein
MANPNKLAPKIQTRVIIVTGGASVAGFSAPLFVSEFAATVSFPTRIKSYSGTPNEMQALLEADGFAADSPARRQVAAAMAQDGPPSTIWIGRSDAADLTWGETLDAIAAENDDDWYAMCVDVRDSASIQQIHAWVTPIGTDPKFALYVAQTDSAQVLNAAPGNFADVIAAYGDNRTVLLYHDPASASGFGPASVTSRTGLFNFGASAELEFRFDGGATQTFTFTNAAAEVLGSNTGPFDLSAGGILTLAANGQTAQEVDFDSTSAEVSSTVAEPFDLEPNDQLFVRVDGGAAQPVTVAAVAAVDLGSVAEPYVLAAAEHLDLEINGGAAQVFVFSGTEATAQEVADLINATAVGFTASDVGGAVELRTDMRGTGASIEVLVASTAGLLVDLGLPVGTQSGTGDVADIDAVTTAELVTVVNADTTGVVASDVDGYLVITADSIGTGSRVQVTGGAVNLVLAFPTSEATGAGPFVDATAAEAAEVAALINESVAGLVASVDTDAVLLTSDILGTSSSIEVTAGAVATELGLAAGLEQGTGDFADASQATAAEIAVVISATVTDGTASAPGSAVKLTSATSGPDSTVEILTDSVDLGWSGDGYAVGTGTDEDYMDCALVGRCVTFKLDSKDGAALWDNQSLAGIEADTLTDAQKTSLEQRRICAYYANGGRAEMHWGTILRKTSADDILYIDEVTSADWLDARMSEDLNALLNRYTDQKAKIPFTDPGFGLIENVFRARLKTSDTNGHTVYDGSPLDLSSDTDTGVFIPRLANLSAEDIRLRRYAGLRARQLYKGGAQRIDSLLELRRPLVQL